MTNRANASRNSGEGDHPENTNRVTFHVLKNQLLLRRWYEKLTSDQL